MIYETLQILKEQLEAYFKEVDLDVNIILDNISMWESGAQEANRLDGNVVMTLLNIEEEATMKNIPAQRVVDNQTEYKNPPVHLNLFLLVSANCSTYDFSLRSISRTIEFFQGKRIFTSSNTVYKRNSASIDLLDHFKFVVDLYTPGFEVMNHIWGTLGGRQLPSALYKIQLVRLSSDKKLATTGVITQIGGRLNKI